MGVATMKTTKEINDGVKQIAWRAFGGNAFTELYSSIHEQCLQTELNQTSLNKSEEIPLLLKLNALENESIKDRTRIADVLYNGTGLLRIDVLDHMLDVLPGMFADYIGTGEQDIYERLWLYTLDRVQELTLHFFDPLADVLQAMRQDFRSKATKTQFQAARFALHKYRQELCKRDVEALALKMPEILTPIKKAILSVLDGQAYPKAKLGPKAGYGISATGKALGELMKSGDVKNKKPLGYYRPDKPPTMI